MTFAPGVEGTAAGGTIRPTLELSHAVEHFEGRAWEDVYRAAPYALRSQHGLRVSRAACATMFMAPDLDVLAFNRVADLGLNAPADRRAIEWIGEAFAAAGVPRYFVPVSPAAEPAALPLWLKAAGLRPYNRWEKLVRGVDDPRPVFTDLTVERVGQGRAPDFARVTAIGFDWPGWVGEWLAALIGRPGWVHYIAYDGATPVAAAMLHHSGTFGWPAFAATLPEHRCRGAQTALLAQRIRDARALGCTILTMDTAENRPDRPCVSNRNALRAGFQPIYLRPNFIHDGHQPDPG